MDPTAQNQVPSTPVPQPLPPQPAAAMPGVQMPQATPVAQPPRESLTDPLSVDAPVVPAPKVAPPATPVSLPHREAGPGLGRMTEFVQPTHAEPVLAPEVKEAGVEVAPNVEQPQIPAAVAQAGVQPAKAAVPVQPVTETVVQYLTDQPFSEVEAVKLEKSTKARDSIRWLATFVLRQIKRIKLFGI